MPSSNSLDIDTIPESYQEYIITIYRLSSELNKVTNIDISQRMQNAPSSVYNMLKKLAKEQLIDWQPKQKEIRLSKKGILIGKHLILGHIIMELFLREYLGLKDEVFIHNLACKLEHHVTEPIKAGFRKKIGDSRFKDLEHIVETEQDPDKTIKKIKEVFPTPNHIINEFASQLSEILPESKKEIEKMKKAYLKEF